MQNTETMTPDAQPIPTSPVEIPTPQKHNKINILVLSIIFLLLGSTSFFAYQYIQLKQQVNSKPTTSPTPFASPKPTAEAGNPTANWKTYSNEKYGFEIKYHPESKPNEFIGNIEAGQFTYLFLIKFGTNPIKSPYGYEFKVDNQKSLDDYRTDLVGHITDKIDSEEETVINNNAWKKINYKIFVTTDYVPITMAIINRAGYGFAISSSAFDIDQILSTFKFLDQPTTTPTAKYSCPASGWVDCMPGPDSKPECSTEAMAWYKANCPNFKGGAL